MNIIFYIFQLHSEIICTIIKRERGKKLKCVVFSLLTLPEKWGLDRGNGDNREISALSSEVFSKSKHKKTAKRTKDVGNARFLAII